MAGKSYFTTWLHTRINGNQQSEGQNIMSLINYLKISSFKLSQKYFYHYPKIENSYIVEILKSKNVNENIVNVSKGFVLPWN